MLKTFVFTLQSVVELNIPPFTRTGVLGLQSLKNQAVQPLFLLHEKIRQHRHYGCHCLIVSYYPLVVRSPMTFLDAFPFA